MNKQTLGGIDCETRDHAPHTCRTGWQEDGDRIALVVAFGLHHIKGNRAPYFSVTATGYTKGRDDFGGACHDVIVQRFPGLADIVALHLAGTDGAPMHAESNAMYWAAGVVDIGAKYHGGSGQFGQTPMKCAHILAKHLRVSMDEAVRLAGAMNKAHKRDGMDGARKVIDDYVAAQRPRWKAEALAVINKYKLGVYGDIRCTHAELLAALEANK